MTRVFTYCESFFYVRKQYRTETTKRQEKPSGSAGWVESPHLCGLSVLLLTREPSVQPFVGRSLYQLVKYCRDYQSYPVK